MLWFARSLAVLFAVACANSAVALPAETGRGHVELLETGDFAEARRVADWIVSSRDNGDRPFVIIDKVNARLFMFAPNGAIGATTAILVGLARGDDSPPGIGTKKLAAITPAERITPAGRFIAEPGENMQGKPIIWIDYDAAISLHRASDRKPGAGAMSREQRLSSSTAAEKRVSLGCINVSTTFYDNFVQPIFGFTKSVAYILPETRSATAEFHIPAAVPGTLIAQKVIGSAG